MEFLSDLVADLETRVEKVFEAITVAREQEKAQDE